MRGFLIVAVGAVALAGCAPFEHGHYANDVTYVNSAGDPAGTPLVFNSNWGDSDYESAKPKRLAKHESWRRPSRHAHRHRHHDAPSVSYAPPVSIDQAYVAPAPSYPAPVNYTTASVQSYAAPVSYTPASTQTYSATSLGGIRFDADGYAICDEVYPQGGPHQGHAAHAPHGYAPAY